MVDEVAKEMSAHEKEVLIHGMEKLNAFFNRKLSKIHDQE
jgi:hypothetical protein